MSKLTRTQLKILGYLAGKIDKKARFNEMVEKLGISRAALSKNLKILVEKGYVLRKVDTETIEYPPPVYYILTEKGSNELNKIKSDIRVEFKEPYKLTVKLDKQTEEVIKGLASSLNLTDEQYLSFLVLSATRCLLESGKDTLSKVDLNRLAISFKAGLGKILSNYSELVNLLDLLNEFMDKLDSSKLEVIGVEYEEFKKLKDNIAKLKDHEAKLAKEINELFRKVVSD